jgi:hypothetical protein
MQSDEAIRKAAVVEELKEAGYSGNDIVHLLLHQHEFGISAHPFRMKSDNGVRRAITGDILPEIAAQLGVNFEPAKNEFLTCDLLDLKHIPEVE